MTLRIAIVGGGLGGLAAALFLRKAGLGVTVYEQAPELREIGAGVVVPPNMVRPLDMLGLAQKLPACAVRIEAAWEFRRWENGRVLFVQPMGEECERLYGAHCYVAHRADPLALFQRALPPQLLRLDHRCVKVSQDEHEVELRRRRPRRVFARCGPEFGTTCSAALRGDSPAASQPRSADEPWYGRCGPPA